MKHLIALSLLVGGAAWADEAPPVRALLADPGQLAAWLRDRDPMIAAARDKSEAANQTVEQTHVLPNPLLQGTAGGFVLGATNPKTPSTDPTQSGPPSLSQTTNYQVGLTELIELGKRG